MSSRPAPVAHPRSRISWPLAVLLLSLGLTASAIVLADFLERQRKHTADQLLGDYAAFVAWSYAEHLKNALLEATWQVVNPVMHEQLHAGEQVPSVERLPEYRAHSLMMCRCDPAYRPALYFGYSLGSDTIAAIDTLLSPIADAGLRSALTAALAHTDEAASARMGVVPLAVGLTAYGLMPTMRQDTIVYGFVFDSSTFPAIARGARDEGDLLPRSVTGGRPVADLIAIDVRTPDGVVLYHDSSWPDPALQRVDSLPTQAGGLRIRTAVRPEAAALLVSGGLSPSTRWLFLGLGAMAIALALVALLQLRREQALARMRTDFVAAVSHELRTPLAQIRLFLETVRLGRYKNDEQYRWLMANVDREARRLGHLVENLLLFTRLDRREPAPDAVEPIDIGMETGEIIDGFAPLAASRRVEFVRTLAAGAVVRIDRDRFRQVVLNLLDNAVKFGPVGQTIAITVESDDARVRLRIRDQGPGIPATESARVWEPFFRGTSADARAVGGSGIGLAIVRELVEQAGGTVAVEAHEGPGTAIVVELAAVTLTPAGVA
ncbi:MAG: HAMP domain-containing sensor histidine kinase [Gemmatimonadales bacterium]